MSSRMFAWSIRLRIAFVRGFQSKRWYSAELPNSSSELVMNTAAAHLPGVLCVSTMRTTPAAIATGKIPACSQPRHDGLISGAAASSAAASMRGSTGTSGAAGRRSRRVTLPG
jgi:hypothetical protein